MLEKSVQVVTMGEVSEGFFDNCEWLCNTCGLVSSLEALVDGKCIRCGGAVEKEEW